MFLNFSDLNDVVAGKSPCLNFDGNKLTTVSGYLSFSPWVEILILSNNQISLVEENSLLFMDRLTSLDLSHNRLQTFPWNVSLSNLTSLLLTFNQLTSLPTETALGTSLRVLNLAYNNLTSVPGHLFFKHVMMVALKGNPWHCDCRLTVLQDWLLLRYHPDATCQSSYVRDDEENGSVGPEPISQCAGSGDIPWMFDPPSCVTPARLQDQCVHGGNFCESSCHGKMQPYEVIPGLNNHIMVRVGKDLVLKCASPTDEDGGLAEWFHPRAGRINVPGQSFCTDEHGNLVMKNIRAGDAGIYICASRHALTLQGYVNVTVLDNFERETPFWDPNFTNSVTTPTVSANAQPISPSAQPMSSTHPPNDTKDSARFHSNVTTDTPIYGPTVPTRSEREGVIELTVSEVTSSAATVRWVTPAHLRGSFLRLFYHERQEGETGRIWMDKEQRSVLIKPGFRRHKLQSLQASTCYVVCISSHTLPGPDECARFRTGAGGLSPLYLAVIPVPLVGLLALACYVKIRNKRRQIRRQYLNPFQTLAENTWNSLSLFGPGVDAVSLRRSAGDYHIYAVPNDDAYDDVCDVVLDPGSSAASYHPRPSYPCGDALEPIYARACTVKKTVREGRRSTTTNAAGKILLRRGSGSYEKACSVTLPMFKIPLPKADPSEAGSVSLNSVYTRACSVRSSYADPSSSQSIVSQQGNMIRGKASSEYLYVSPVDVSRTRVRGIEDPSAPQDHVFVDVSTESLASSDDVSIPGWEEEEQAGYMQVGTPFRDFARSDATFSHRPVSW
ncbi:uncharacterized protein LOC144916414 [Branchiostoma floridae x Branchiostoma belcheri]